MSVTTGKPAKSATKQAGKVINQTDPTNATQRSQVGIVIDVLTVNLFFDGTKNNKYNIDNQTKYTRNIKKDPKGFEGYANAYSNVAHLYEATKQLDKQRKRVDVINLYVEGMGTAKDQVDDQQGFALGSGVTGITSRASKAFDDMRGLIDVKRKKFTIARIRLNVFGFSRGAATARHFLSKLKGHKKLSNWGVDIAFRVNFVGLFDTVSSFDPRSVSEVGWDTVGAATQPLTQNIGARGFRMEPERHGHLPEFNDDVNELDLHLDNDIDNHPLKVFQICAKDEYRTFFSLTDIESARLGQGRVDNKFTGFGYEIYLPGAHSDIGGGYPNGINEKYRCSKDEYRLSNWLLRERFYNQAQAETEIRGDGSSGATTFYRTKIPFDAYMIALKVMYDMAVQEGGMVGIFDDKYIQDKCHSTYPMIKHLVDDIPSRVLAGVKQRGWHANLGIFDFSQHYPDLKAFRNQFIHWSAKKELGYEVRRGSATSHNALGDGKQVAVDTGFNLNINPILLSDPYRRIHYG